MPTGASWEESLEQIARFHQPDQYATNQGARECKVATPAQATVICSTRIVYSKVLSIDLTVSVQLLLNRLVTQRLASFKSFNQGIELLIFVVISQKLFCVWFTKIKYFPGRHTASTHLLHLLGECY